MQQTPSVYGVLPAQDDRLPKGYKSDLSYLSEDLLQVIVQQNHKAHKEVERAHFGFGTHSF